MIKDLGSYSRLIIAAAVIILGLIYFADLLTPLAMAIFLWLTIDGFAVYLHKRFPKISRKFAVPITFLLVFIILTFIVVFASEYARSFARDFHVYRLRLDIIITQIYGHFPIQGHAPTLSELLGKVNPSILLNGIGDVLKGFGGDALFVLIYVISLFAMQSSFPKKIINIFPDKIKRDNMIAISTQIRKSMEAYLWVQTITGIMITLACWALFAIIGLKNALFWALVTFLLSYIPAIGGLVASVLPALFALVQFTSPLNAIIILGITQAIQFIIGNIIQPRMTGDSLNLSVLMVFLSLAFWGKIWGGSGMFLAVPITVMIMIILSQFKETRAIAILMSANGNPDGEIALPKKIRKIKTSKAKIE